jgi:hypothetical protein
MYLGHHHLKILPTLELWTPRSSIWHVPLVQRRRSLIGRKLQWIMQGGKHIAKQLDCATSIASTQNNGIHGILFSQHTTFNRLNHLVSKRQHGLINIWGVDWITSKSNHSNQQMPCKNSSLNAISGFAMIVGLWIIHISSEHYTTGIFSNVSSVFCTSPISGALPFWTGGPHRLGK